MRCPECAGVLVAVKTGHRCRRCKITYEQLTLFGEVEAIGKGSRREKGRGQTGSEKTDTKPKRKISAVKRDGRATGICQVD